MVIHILLTVLDLVAAFVLVLHATLGWFSTETILYNAFYLILKGLIFAINDWPSRIDILAGIYMVLISFNIFSNNILTVITAVWLGQKIVFILFDFLFRMVAG
ncbi:MAG: hypothetical protein HYT70_04400 [Candidatus Aenigmarchaeota archaeon]|nr:hypothetical protein [Candidatus Aenigmarchaeota archaeon]